LRAIRRGGAPHRPTEDGPRGIRSDRAWLLSLLPEPRAELARAAALHRRGARADGLEAVGPKWLTSSNSSRASSKVTICPGGPLENSRADRHGRAARGRDLHARRTRRPYAALPRPAPLMPHSIWFGKVADSRLPGDVTRHVSPAEPKTNSAQWLTRR